MQGTPRFLLVSSLVFDGVSEDSGKYLPDLNRSQPRAIGVREAADTTGRFPFNKLARRGTSGLVAYIRCHGAVSPGDIIGVRSRKSGEGDGTLIDDPFPLVDDSLLETRPLQTTWVGPFLLGPTDAFTITTTGGGAGPAPHNVEFCLYELDDEGFRFLLTSPGFLAAYQVPAISRLLITTPGAIPAWSGLLYASATIAAPGPNVLTLPDAGPMKIGDRVHLDREGGSLFRVEPIAGQKINGRTLAAGASILFSEGNVGVIFERVDADNWEATADSQGPLVLPVAATPFAIPTFAGDLFIDVSAPAFGQVVLPVTDLIGIGQRAIVTNVDSPLGFFVKVAVDATETIDGQFGVVGAIVKTIILPLKGDVVIFERIANGWRTVDNKTDLESLTQTSALAAIVYTQGWRGRRSLRLSNAVGASVTLPPFAETPQGCGLLVRGTVVAPTIQTSALGELIIGAGATGAAVVLANVNTWGYFEFNGSEWARY